MSSEKNEKLSTEEIKDVEGGSLGVVLPRKIHCPCGKIWIVAYGEDYTCPNCGQYYPAHG